MKARKAVSEVLGYILVLSIVVATITVIYAAGMPAIKSQQDIASFRSMENTFYVLQNIVRLVAYNITPEKAVTIRAEGGSIVVAPDWGAIKIIAWYGNSPNPSHGNIIWEFPQNGFFKYGAILYVDNRGRTLLLENGAVIACYSGERFLNLSDPRIFCIKHFNKLYLYLSIINITGAVSFAGMKTLVFKNIGSEVNDSLRLDTLNPALHWYGQPQNLRIIIHELKANQFGIDGTKLSQWWIDHLRKIFNNSGVDIVSYNATSITIRIRGQGVQATPIKLLNLTVGVYNITVSG